MSSLPNLDFFESLFQVEDNVLFAMVFSFSAKITLEFNSTVALGNNCEFVNILLALARLRGFKIGI